jgi:hypothetical protein
MAKRLHQDKVTGPNGESLKVNWMPDGRVRLDFENCSQCVVTKLFPDPMVRRILKSATEPKRQSVNWSNQAGLRGTESVVSRP